MRVSGAALTRAYYEQVVGPMIAARWPGLPHAAGRLGSGSDVLGLDDVASRDHDWGLRLNLLIPAGMTRQVDVHLETMLPVTFDGYPTRFATTWDPRRCATACRWTTSPASWRHGPVSAPTGRCRSRTGCR